MKEGKHFGKEGLKPVQKLHKSIRAEKISFDPKQSNGSNTHFSSFRPAMPMDENEALFKRSEAISSNSEKSIKTYKTENKTDVFYTTCQSPGNPIPVSFERRLSVDVVSESQEEKNNVCQGHIYKLHCSSREQAEKEWEKFKKNKNFLSIENHIVKRKKKHSNPYKLIVRYWHEDDSNHCTNYKVKKTETQVLKEISDIWKSTNPDAENLYHSSHVTQLDIQCLDTSPKWINGKEVKRDCWREKISFLVHPKGKNTCVFPKDVYLEEIGRTCLKSTPFGCLLWSIDFRGCQKQTLQVEPLDSSSIIGTDENAWDTDYEDNQSFDDIALKLSVFEEVEKELSTQGTEYPIFKGSVRICSQSVADDILYDCCSSSKGLAEKLKLSQCNAEELALSEMKEKGMCRYIGEKEGKFLGLWKSRTEKVYCCFSSKLARIFQEQAREQLNISWGSAKRPNSRGLSPKEIANLNFHQIDLSELKDTLDHQKIKLQNFENSLREKMQKEAIL